MASKTPLVLGASLAAAIAVRRAVASRRRRRSCAPLATTVHLPVDRLPDRLPGPLAELGGAVEITRTAAPGDRGTEVRVQVLDCRKVSRESARLALRQAKELLETGELHPPDEPVTRRRTLVSAPLETAIRRAGREGRL